MATGIKNSPRSEFCKPGAADPLPGISQVLHLPVTDSTQTVARFLAQQGAPHGTLVWADRQTAGKGRLERKWKSAPGGLYISLILRPSFPPSRLAELSVKTAEAAAKVVRSLTGVEAVVKPPNDVYAVQDGTARKICGILAEASGDSRKTDWLVLGVGINVNNAPRLRSATSLRGLAGRPQEISEVLTQFMIEFQLSYENLIRT